MLTLDANDIDIQFDIPPLALPNDRCAIDTEFFGMEKKRLHRPHGKFASLGCTYDGKTVYMIFDENKIKDFYARVDPAVHIYHNAMFDVRQLRRFADILDRKRIWDTMLIEQIMYSGYYDSFSLADLARRYCGIYLPKEERESFSIDDKMDDQKIFYAACDVVATWMVQQEQAKVVDDDDWKIWTKIERPMLWVVLGMGGPQLNSKAWLKLADSNQQRADELKAKFPFNPASPKQVKEALIKEGWEVESTNEATLESIQEQSEIASKVLEFRKKAKLASTYGKDFVDEYVEADGRIYSSYHLIGAETGRLSSSNPNAQNIVHDVEYRDCFEAADGHMLVISDWSSQEPRNLAYLSQDKKLIEILNSRHDVYIEVGYEVFEERFEKKDSRRDEMKAIILGLSYGMSKYGLARKLKKDEDYCQELIDRFFDKFPGVQEYLEQQEKAKDYVRTILGRKIWLNHHTNQWYRNALNGPIQGSAADAFKIASAKFIERYEENPLILLVHDEMVIEVPKDRAETAAKILKEVMIETAEEMHPGVSANTETTIGKTWAAKKK